MPDKITAKIESYLFYSGDAESFSTLAKHCSISKQDVSIQLDKLSSELTDRGVSLIIHDETAKLVIAKEYSEFIEEIRHASIDSDLTDAQAEALSVVAYLAPVQKMAIDFIRGVNSRAVLRNLAARGLVRSRKENSIKCYVLTSDALAHLGISDTDQLPDYGETRNQLQEFVHSDTQMSLEIEGDDE
ncbi:MAG: SMC-Scp complex subunit ScpB [Candidatus Paceibacterota bacterium]